MRPTLAARFALLAGVLSLTACGQGDLQGDAPVAGADLRSATLTRARYGITPDGRTAELFTLTNASGVKVSFTNYGGVITAIEVPDRDGRLGNVVLGFESIEGYFESPFTSSLIGRYANRIAGGRFVLDDSTYELARNNGPNHLHGGPGGFHRRLWHAVPTADSIGSGVALHYTSPDGEEGYPGTLTAQVTYTLTTDNALVIDYQATTDKSTPVNLTHHAYFNLSADTTRDILDHELMLNASHYTPVDSSLIPLGEIVSVRGTPFDFSEPTPIGAQINADHPQIRPGSGYDHNWVLDRQGAGLSLAARLRDPQSGRVLEVMTTEPGIQIYTGFRRRHGIALETQHFPNSPNEPDFPSTILRPGDEYRSSTVFRFGIEP